MTLACTYHNSTGRLVCRDASGRTTVDHTGYAGTGAGRNNPAMENVRNVGPIPQGNYSVGTGACRSDHGSADAQRGSGRRDEYPRARCVQDPRQQ